MKIKMFCKHADSVTSEQVEHSVLDLFYISTLVMTLAAATTIVLTGLGLFFPIVVGAKLTMTAVLFTTCLMVLAAFFTPVRAKCTICGKKTWIKRFKFYEIRNKQEWR